MINRPFLLFFVCFVSAPCFATTFYQRPFPKTVRTAPAIVRGKVGSSVANWVVDSDGNKRIYTFTTLESVEALKGDLSGGSLVVRTLGGEKDGIGLHVPGSPEFTRGEDVVLMVSDRNPDGSRDVDGMMMGKFGIETDAEGNELLKGPGLNPLGFEGPFSHEDQQSQNGDTVRQNGTKWSVLALKELIQEQSESPNDADGPVSNASQTFASQTSTATTTHSQTASELQSSTPKGEGTSSSSGKGIAAGLGIVLVAWLLWFRLRKKN